MPTKKDVTTQLSPEEQTRVEQLLADYPQQSERLYETSNRVQIEEALADIFQAAEPVQITLVKELGRTNQSAAADVLSAINVVSPQKEIRKEARRALIRLESSKTYPRWKAPAIESAAVQIPVANPPRFWKGYASQTRDEGEVHLVLVWEQGYEYNEALMMVFLLDFWEEGVKDFVTETGTKRHIEERIGQVRTMRGGSSVLQLASSTLAEGKRLLNEALGVNEWRKTTPAESYRAYLPTIKKLVLNVEDAGADSGQTLIPHDLETQEVAVDFIGSWSFGDYGLSYDLLSSDSALRNGLERDEWIDLHRAWFDEAHPTHMQLGFVHEVEQPQSALWVPTTVKRAPSKKVLEVGWSLELADTQLSGTIPEMPMGTAVNKETGRHWFWSNFTLVQEQNAWRVQQVQDQGIALQGLTPDELKKRIKSYEDAIDQRLKERETNPEAFNQNDFVEELAWRLTQLLHFDDALLLLSQESDDYDIYQTAYEHAVLTGDPERIVTYLERMAQRFPERKADTYRRLGSTLAEMAFRYDSEQMKARREYLLRRAEEVLREVLTIEDNAVSRTLLGELLMTLERNDDAQSEFEQALARMPENVPEDEKEQNQNMLASIEAGMGNVAMRREQFAEAIPHYQKVAQLSPRYTGVWFSLGFAHRLLKQLEQAEVYYQQALQQDPSDPRVYSELTAIYMQQQDSAKALALLERGLRILPDSSYLHTLIASVYATMNDQRQAKRHLEEAERLDPDSEIIPAVRQQISDLRRK